MLQIAHSKRRSELLHVAKSLRQTFGTMALTAFALLSAARIEAACPFVVNNALPMSAPSDGLQLTQFARRDTSSTLAQRERATHQHIAANLVRLDMNADGVFDTTDALIAARAMLGFRDEQLTNGLILSGARNTFEAVQSFVDGGCIADAATTSRWQSASFTESSDVIANPERGFWAFFGSDFSTLDSGTINWMKTTWPDMTLGYGVARLDSYRNTSTLPQSYLDALTAAFAKVRAGGMKVVLRFAYNYPQGEAAPITDDAPLNTVLSHIQQLAPIVQANADVIYVWQAGFIGMWGEGHSSTNNLTTDANKATIRDALLAALPSGRFLLWRYPPDQILWDAQPGVEADAFGASRKARMGMYNDCFMASNTDVGTYDDNATVRATQRAYIAARSAIAPFGGETCNAQPTSEQRLTCADIRREGAEFHLTYLNRSYHEGFMNRWIADGCFTEVSNKIGHRWVLDSANVPTTVARGSAASIAVTMRNVGWARLYNARTLQVQLVSRANPSAPPIVANAAWDPRMLKPGESASVLFNVNVSAAIAPGVYDVFVASPDAAISLATNAAYAMRFANSDSVAANQAWNATRGAFATGVSITVN
jgi:hypothetical protein